ncbi:MAG: hypothetical protein QGH60_06650 [Phycisphaerae bacterium]|jgi:hypothetical protein|nr:hypothetical protein [Phycisphaerae bacterium]
MRPKAGVLFAVVLALTAVSIAARKAPAPTEGKITLTYDSGKSVTCLTPQWASGGKQVSATGSMAKVRLAGKSIPAAGWKSGKGYRIGLDSNGDNIVNTEEYRQVAPKGAVVLTGKVEGKQLSVRCVEVSVRYDEKEGEVLSMRWRMQGVYGWIGKIDSVKIRILDENLDGKYGHNGADAIQIGNAKLALPLRGQHRIGENFYKLKIAADGSSLEFKKISDPQVGLVRTPFKGKYLLGLVLDGPSGAFDVQACNRTGIPAGTYSVAYGAIGDPRAPLSLSSGRNTLKYEIQADKKNLLRIGPPLQLVFSGQYKEEKKDKKDKNNKQIVRRLGIRRPTMITGAGGEEYGPISFSNARRAKGRPAVMILQGSKTLVKATMPERDGNLQDYWWELPRKLSPRGIRVVMAASIPGFGKVMGVKTIQQIAGVEKKDPTPKKVKPSVIVTPWKRPGKPTRIVKKPKDPVGVKPRPTTRPSTVTRPTKKPKPAASDEQKAARLVKLAESYDKMNLRAKSIEVLKKILEKYPKTKAAITARVLLTAMQ